jgi:hypothetical protein
VTIIIGGFDRWTEAGFPTEGKMREEDVQPPA